MNQTAQKILSYLTSLSSRPDKRVISGQFVGSNIVKHLDDHIKAVHDDTGKWISCVGSDFGWIEDGRLTDWERARDALVTLWDAGHLVTMCWHMRNPLSGNHDDLRKPDFRELITPGTPLNDAWMADVSEKADWLTDLRDAGVVVIWRPFHEMNMNSGWWKAQPPDEFIDAWRYLHNYMTVQRGLDNLLWLYAPGSTSGWQDKTDYYPQVPYVDLTGLSWYVENKPLSQADQRGYPQLVALGHPFVLAEFGPGKGSEKPTPNTYNYKNAIDDIRAHCPRCVMVSPWYKEYSIASQLNAGGFLGDPWMVNRDDLNWNVEPPGEQPDWAIIAAHLDDMGKKMKQAGNEAIALGDYLRGL